MEIEGIELMGENVRSKLKSCGEGVKIYPMAKIAFPDKVVLGAHTKVHDANGGVPAAYAEDYVNPTGRTFRITLRKHFR